MKACNACGKCCVKYSNGSLSASENEIEYWEVFKPYIAKYVSKGEIWMNPENGQQLTLCPWLKKETGSNRFLCDIYYDRPDDCRYYPVTIAEMINDECEMLEAKDIENPQQAQKSLDIIMADSRD